MKRRLASLLQLAIGIGLVAWLLNHIQLDRIAGSLRSIGSAWPWLLIGTILYVSCTITCSVRWQFLLAAQSIPISIREAIRLYMIGHFFNAFVLGSTGGDLMKAYYATRATPEKKTEAATSVFLDRAIGLVALIGVMLVVMLCRLDFFLSFPETVATLYFGAALGLGAVIGITAVFGQNWFERWPTLGRLRDKSPAGAVLNRVYQSSRFCLSHPLLILKTTILSVLNQLSYFLIAWCVGQALSIEMSYLDYLSVVPVISVVSAIPATPGGLGTREAATVFLLGGAFGVPEAIAFTLSILLLTIVTVWSLLGGVVYLLDSGGKTTTAQVKG